MLERRIDYLESAVADLERLSDWLLEVASTDQADRYIDRIRERIQTLRYGSERGTVRSETDGIRVVGIMRSITVAFAVQPDCVRIVRILYRGQNWQAVQASQEDVDETD